MATKNRKAIGAILTCVGCGQEFTPYKGRERTQRYCSLPCSRAAGHQKMRQMHAEGVPFGWVALKASQAGRPTAATVRAEGKRPERPVPTFAPYGYVAPVGDAQPTHREQQTTHAAEEWGAAGARYERLTAQAAKKERDGRTLILAGYGAGLRVERDALIVSEGHTHAPQTQIVHTLHRAMHDVERIVWLGAVGSLSFPAIHWCAQQGIAVLLLTRDGALLNTLTPEAAADVRLRRAQYMAQANGQDVVIARDLMRRKLEGQRATIEGHPELPDRERALEALTMALSWLSLPEPPPWLSSMEVIRTYEGRAARAYFAAWTGLPLRWATKADAKRVPPHWLSVRERNSPLASQGNARHAVDPANAILNYAYGVLEGQVRQALSARGFDLACGFLHADKAGRDSLVYDLMECERGAVDGLALHLLKDTTFRKGDFLALSDGTCRLHPQLARAVVARCRVPHERLDTHARWLAGQLSLPPSVR